jgi:phosphate transport system protein
LIADTPESSPRIVAGEARMPRQSFHQELREIEEAVIQMASLVENAITRAMQALVRRDTLLAEDVKASDGMVNELQRNIRNRCISVMARQAPVARDLRELTTVQLVINELERMGDHAVGIAKQVARLQDFEPLAITGELSEMAKLVREQVHAGIEAFVDVNVQQARDICARDDEIDHEYKATFAELLGVMSKDPATIPAATSLLFVAHDLERIGDRVTNICEDVIYMVSGEIEELN